MSDVCRSRPTDTGLVYLDQPAPFRINGSEYCPRRKAASLALLGAVRLALRQSSQPRDSVACKSDRPRKANLRQRDSRSHQVWLNCLYFLRRYRHDQSLFCLPHLGVRVEALCAGRRHHSDVSHEPEATKLRLHILVLNKSPTLSKSKRQKEYLCLRITLPLFLLFQPGPRPHVPPQRQAQHPYETFRA